jgi:GNAT superfamily N-acetyltransferase
MMNLAPPETATDLCRPLAWDSDFFGFGIAAVNGAQLTRERAEAVDRWAAARRVRCLYFFADPNDEHTIRVAEERGYALVDIRMTYGSRLRQWRSSLPESSIREVRRATEADLPAMKALARTAHRNTRFYRDVHFSHRRCDDLYERWIERSFEGWADRVFVAGPEGSPTGYVTVHREPGDLRLVAVREDARGLGVGKVLYQAALTWLADEGVDTARSPTQVFNIAAQRLFQSVNLQLTSVSFIYHRWFEVESRS